MHLNLKRIAAGHGHCRPENPNKFARAPQAAEMPPPPPPPPPLRGVADTPAPVGAAQADDPAAISMFKARQPRSQSSVLTRAWPATKVC